jgi:hypothetical protein
LRPISHVEEVKRGGPGRTQKDGGTHGALTSRISVGIIGHLSNRIKSKNIDFYSFFFISAKLNC